tara:strand:- start:2826 stop:3188 length:363 start_codon:yes stop_codon:yes gene_type:complete
MAFKLKLKNVSASGEKASPFKISEALVAGAGVAADRFVNMEDSYAVGAGAGSKTGRGGTDLFKKNKGKGGSETCEDKFPDISSPEFEACMDEKEESTKDTTTPVEGADGAEGDSEIVEAG